MIETGDKALKLGAQEPAQQGHQRLENAKIKAGDDQMTRLEGGLAQALADRHSQRIHGKAYRQYEQFGKTHDGIAPLSSFFYSVQEIGHRRAADHGVAQPAEGVRHLAEDQKAPQG